MTNMIDKQETGSFDVSDLVTSQLDGSIQTGFLDLPRVGLNGLASFSLFTRVYEDDLIKAGGVDISRLEYKGRVTPAQLAHGRFLVFHPNRDVLDLSVLEKHVNHEFPCSMLVTDLSDFENHIQRIYQVAHAYYVFGKKNVEGYPKNNCIVGTNGVYQSLLKHGYVNVAKCLDKGHMFNILPFIFGEQKTEGLIVLDATSNLLWDFWWAPRNEMIILTGQRTRWKHDTGWNDYLGERDYARITHPVISKGEEGVVLSSARESLHAFYEKAFKNPTRLNI